jgi:hypothetical protein
MRSQSPDTALEEFLSTNQKTADIISYDNTSGFLQEIAGDAHRVRPDEARRFFYLERGSK